MNSKVIFAVLFLGLLCTSCFVEASPKWRGWKRIGHAVEKVGKKVLDDGTVSKVILGSAIAGRKRRSADEAIRVEEIEQLDSNESVPY